ncbi:MAG: hypothetical protein ACFHU9_09800 [Fluviicola sp.]
MKLRLTLLFIVFGIVLSSCSEIRKRRKKVQQPELKAFVFKTNYFMTGEELNYSFPTWFNDSIIADAKIKTVVHKWFNVSDDSDSGDLLRLRRYTFDGEGRLTSVQQQRFYENMQVENITFQYRKAPDQMGYAEVEIFDSLHAEGAVEYTTYSKDTYRDGYAVYENDHSGDLLFCLLRKEYQGIMAVDSLFGPTPDDIIQYGKPSKPYKRYQIQNLVEEIKVVRYNYFKESSELRSRRKENYPFLNKTFVTVGKDGQCTGFIDSTFSAGEYLNRTVSTFSYNESQFPSRLTHKGMRNGKYETFEYSFYE